VRVCTSRRGRHQNREIRLWQGFDGELDGAIHSEEIGVQRFGEVAARPLRADEERTLRPLRERVDEPFLRMNIGDDISAKTQS